MKPAYGDESGLVLLFITEEDFLNETASTIAQRALLAGLSEFGIASQVICRSDQVAPEPVALAKNPADEGTAARATGGQSAPLSPNFQLDRPNAAAAHQSPPESAEDGLASDLGVLVAAALDRQRADLAVIRSGTNTAQVLAACRTRDVPTAVIWDGGDPLGARRLAGADAILASSQAVADYLREAFGLPAVVMPPLVLEPEVRAGATASHIVFDGSLPNSGFYVFAQIAAEIDRRRPNTPVTILGPDGALESTTGSLVAPGVDEATRAAKRNPQDIWPHARVLLAPLLDWQRTPFSALTAMSYGVPILISDRGPVAEWFGEGALVLPLPSRLLGAAPMPVQAADVATWVETVLRLYDDAAFAARQRSLAVASARRFSAETLVAEYAQFFEQVARKHSRRPAPTNGQLQIDPFVSRTERLAVNHPWPSQPPPGRRRSCVLVPHLNGIDWECEQGLRHLDASGVRVVRRGGCSAIDVARNEMLSDALHDEAESILFIDSDIGFDPQDALNLLARPEDVVAAIYAKKNHREMASIFADGVKQVMFGGNASGLYPLKFAAAGFLRIRAQVLRRMIAELRLPLCNTHWGRGVWPFFQPVIVPHGNEGLHYLGEDWAFSHRLAEIGVTPLADTSIRLWHWGRYGFSWEDAGQDASRYANYLYHF